MNQSEVNAILSIGYACEFFAPNYSLLIGGRLKKAKQIPEITAVVRNP
jgi:hypothetical protein